VADDLYVDLGLTAQADPTELRERQLARFAEAMPDGWIAPQAGPVWLGADANAELAAEREAQAIEVARRIFQEFGSTVYGVNIGAERTATGTSTWTVSAVPLVGAVIPAGTPLARGEILLETVSDVVVTEDGTITDVAVSAVNPGVYGDVVAGAVDVLASLGFIASAVIDAPGTTGGLDGEELDDYMNRLRLHIAHAGRPVLPADHAAKLRDLFPLVHRVLALDLYDADTDTDGVEKHITLVPVDASGEPLPGPTLIEAAAQLDAEREVNFVVHVIEPTYTTINASATITVWPEWDPDTVSANASAAVESWLAPAAWGQPPNGDSPLWHDEPIVLRDELSAVLNMVGGVRHVTLPKLAESPSSPAASDVTLDGPAPLTRAGTITITVA